MVFMWGIGGSAGYYINRYISLDKISGFIVSEVKNNHSSFMGKKVYSPWEIASKEYEAIIVASVYTENIYRDCMKYDIDMSKVCFLCRHQVVGDDGYNEKILRRYLDSQYMEAVKHNSIVIQGMEIDNSLGFGCGEGYQPRVEGMYQVDYVRVRTFELIADEIISSEVHGNVAELGCFRGAFAYYINKRFADRRLYLFDTFEGFDSVEVEQEIYAGNATDTLIQVFSNTNIDLVLNYLPHPQMVEIKRGYFPKSLHGMEDTFAFVSIDVDLEMSIYNGLDYLYPRVASGGYIMIHDYNSRFYGVKNAIKNYEQNYHCLLHKVPLSDTAGTLVIVKS